MGIHDVFHASLLNAIQGGPMNTEQISIEPPPKLIEGEEEWEIEQILGK